MNKTFLNFGRIMSFTQLHKILKLKNSLRVLYTHEVCYSDFNNFEKNINYLSNFSLFVKPDYFFKNFKNPNDYNGKKLILTFDDGFLSSYHFAKKVLSKFNIKAIFFIPTAILQLSEYKSMESFVKKNIYYNKLNNKKLKKDEIELMGKKELVDLVKEGHMIFPHTHNHIFIKNIVNKKMVNLELKDPKNIMREISNIDYNAFAFPVGTEKQVSKYAYGEITKIYDYCFTALSGVIDENSNPHKLHRTFLPADASLEYVKMAVNGVYDFYYKYKMRKIFSMVK